MSALSSGQGNGAHTGPFHFKPAQGRIDWAALGDLDLLRVVRETDLDSVEAVLGSIAHGSLQAADPAEATPEAVGRLFGVSQLAVQYFIYVQERLASDVRESKMKLSISQKETRSLKDTVSHLEREVAAAQREARHTRRLLKSMVAPPTPAVLPHTSIHQQGLLPSTVPPRQDPEAKECLQRLDAGIRELLAWKETAASRELPLRQQQQQEPKAEARPPSPPPEADRAPPRNPSEPPPPQQCSIPPVPDGNQCSTRAEECTPPPSELPSPPLRSAPPPVRTQLPSSSAASPSTPPSPPSPTTNAATPSQMGHFLREHPHEAIGYERPGVISRFPHRLSALRAMRAELQAELAAELSTQLAYNGVDPDGCQGLTSGQYLACVDGLRQRRSDALEHMGKEDKEREAYMRNTIRCHVDKVTKAAAAYTGGLRSEWQPDKRAGASHGNHHHQQQQRSYLSPETAAALASGAYPSEGLVDDGVGEFYSPLRKGTSEPGTPHASI